MLARVFSCAVIGLDGVVVEVEVDTGGGLPKMVIVGLPVAAIHVPESRLEPGYHRELRTNMHIMTI